MKSLRRRAREVAVQSLYQWQITGDRKLEQMGDAADSGKVDEAYLEDLLKGIVNDAATIEDALQPHLDRPFVDVSPVERSILLLGGYELMHHPEIPYRVVINEAVELAKAFGGTDGHKYVNGVLDKLAARVRAVEVQAR